MSKPLPRGLWFEKKYKRWRVRLYKDGKAHLAGYFRTQGEARVALEVLKKKLKSMGAPEAAASQLKTGVITI